MTNKEEFLHIYNEYVKRQGSQEFLDWLLKTDFFTAPASTKYHGACEGGLLLHSLNVYKTLRERYLRRARIARKVLLFVPYSTIYARLNSIRFRQEMLRMMLQVSGKKFLIIRLRTHFLMDTAKNQYF